MAVPNSRLFSPGLLNDQAICTLVNVICQHKQISPLDLNGAEYSGLAQLINKELSKFQQVATHFAAQNLDELLAIIRILRDNRAIPRRDVFQQIKAICGAAEDFAIACSMALALRLWLGVCIDTFELLPTIIAETTVVWQDHQFLIGLIQEQFPKDESPPSGRHLDRTVSAASLKNFCGVELNFTNNLVDYLKLSSADGFRALSIYETKTFPGQPPRGISDAAHNGQGFSCRDVTHLGHSLPVASCENKEDSHAKKSHALVIPAQSTL